MLIIMLLDPEEGLFVICWLAGYLVHIDLHISG